MLIERGKWLIEFSEDWTQVLERKRWNWLSYRILKIEIEDDHSLGNVELQLALFGFGLRVAYIYAQTELRRNLDASLLEFEERMEAEET